MTARETTADQVPAAELPPMVRVVAEALQRASDDLPASLTVRARDMAFASMSGAMSVHLAAVAMKAMRFPTDAMCEAARASGAVMNDTYDIRHHHLQQVWGTMIDAALGEAP